MSISDQIITYNRCVVALNGHLMIRNGPTIDVWWKCKSISDQIGHLQQECMPISEQIVTYNRCVVALNGHLMIRKGLTIGVWWTCMSISDQIGHQQ